MRCRYCDGVSVEVKAVSDMYGSDAADELTLAAFDFILFETGMLYFLGEAPAVVPVICRAWDACPPTA